MIYIASDHGGFKLKEKIKGHLSKSKLSFVDLGPHSFDPDDDYPDFAKKVAEKISSKPKQDVGILLCRSGQGVNITANKFKNVRAALVWNVKEAIASRRDDLANVLSIPSDYVSEKTAKKLADAWLQESMGTEKRHVRRVNKISKIEKSQKL